MEEAVEMTRNERRAEKRERKNQKRREAAKSRKIKKFGLWGAGLLVVLVVGYLGYLSANKPETVRPGEEFPIEGRAHVSEETVVEYKTNPPTSGDHFAQPADWGVYSEEIPDGAVVHSLEHGGIWISYKDIDDDSRARLEGIGNDNKLSVVVSPRSANDTPIAVASWGRLLKMETVDEEAIREFIRINKNNSPERLAR